MSELADLLERVKVLTGPDREVDEAIRFYFDPVGSVFYSESDAYTASIDAALSLVERVLPGWLFRLDQYGEWYDCNLAHWSSSEGVFLDDIDATASTAPLAIILALLTALDQKEEDK